MTDIVDALREPISMSMFRRKDDMIGYLLAIRGEAAAEIERLRLSLSEAIAQRDAAFEMSKCECGTDEACRNLVEARATGRREGLSEAAGILLAKSEELRANENPTSTAMAMIFEEQAAAIRAAMEKEE